MTLSPQAYAGVIAQPGETFYHVVRSVSEIVERHHSRYTGANVGVSIRIAPGVSVYGAPRRGAREDVAEHVVDDRGDLYLSNKRVLFVGRSHTTSIPLFHIVCTVDYRDAVKIDRSNASALMYGIENGNAGLLIRRIISGHFEPVPLTIQE